MDKKRYKLPNKYHDVEADVVQLVSTLKTVDADVTKIEEDTRNTEEKVTNIKNRLLRASISDPVIRGIAPNTYVVLNETGDGLECIEGGGAPGGKTGQHSIKRSNNSFDFVWGNLCDVSKGGMRALQNLEESDGGETHIFCNDDDVEIQNEKQFPNVAIIDHQVTSDFIFEANEGAILKDEIEKNDEIVLRATKKNFGVVKVGAGLNVENGVLSVPIYSNATKTEAGIVSIGEGLKIKEDGTLSRAELEHASFEKFGIVKLGKNIGVNDEGEIEKRDLMPELLIYDKGAVKICENYLVSLEDTISKYRVFIREDCVIGFETLFDPIGDFAFELELVSDGAHIVHFNELLSPQLSPLPINRGTTLLKLEKMLGVPQYNAEISRLDAPQPELLTPDIGDDISNDLKIWSNGLGVTPHEVFTVNSNFVNVSEEEIWLEFNGLVAVEYIIMPLLDKAKSVVNVGLYGSADGENWTSLLSIEDKLTDSNPIYTTRKGCFKYYKFHFDKRNQNSLQYLQLWGTKIENNESEIICLTPRMASNNESFAMMTASGWESGNASQITDNTTSATAAYVKYSADPDDQLRWLKYEFPEPKVENILEVAAPNTWLSRSMTWYKLEGSNDDENWDLLLERAYLRGFNGNENRFHEFQNEKAYKFYKLSCISTVSDPNYWVISKFKLFRREKGRTHFYSGLPPLTMPEQDGYEISASGQYDDSYKPEFLFDKDLKTKWCVAGTGANQWVKLKLPAALVFNGILMATRSDGNFLTQTPKNFEVQGSNDDENWTTLFKKEDATWSKMGEQQLFKFENETPFVYYRFFIKANNGGTDTSFALLDFGEAKKEYKRVLKFNEFVLPIMTDSEVEGEGGTYKITCNSESTTYKAFYLFDRNPNSNFDLSGTLEGWICAELPVAKVVNRLSIGARADSWCGGAPRDYSLLASNDEKEWATLLKVENSEEFASQEVRNHDLNNTKAYKFYKINIGNPARSVLTFVQLDLICKHDVKEY